MPTKLQLTDHFTAGRDPYRMQRWKKHDCVINDSSGQVIFSLRGVQAPESWSPLAIEIAAAKYFRKTAGKKTRGEKSVRQMIERVVTAITQSGRRQKYFASRAQADVFSRELAFILLTQRGFFNSPVWFNCGLYEAYGITSPSTQWAWDFAKKKPVNVGEAYRRPQVSACFIQSVDDNLESIFELAKNEARLFKYGSGSGTNFSNLRAKDETLQGGGSSSGLLSFLQVLDRGAGAIKSGGTTRRAAKMVCLDVDHPEISDFIDWKMKEEKKAEDLVAAGYSGELEGEAYLSVSGQNSNNSVRVGESYMQAVKKDGDWALRARKTGKIIRKVKAKKLWRQIAQAAWACADPGLQFDGAIQRWHTCPQSGAIRASNPCSEFMFLDDTACNLASLNLLKFITAEGDFDMEGFVHTCRIIFLAQEILVDMAGYPTEKICRNSHEFRPLGLGYCGLGAFLLQQGMAYDSEEGRAWASALAALLSGAAYQLSAELAALKGSFHRYKENKNAMLKVLKKHHRAARRFFSQLKGQSTAPSINSLHRLTQVAIGQWQNALQSGRRNGFRHAQVSVMAPTGTIGLVLDSDTTGIEPEFSFIKNKKLVGGGELAMMSQSLAKGLQRLNYSLEDRERILSYVKMSGSTKSCPDIRADHKKVFASAMDIPPLGHLQMMAAIQPFVSGAISKTVNLPKEASPEDIEQIYWLAWELGLKSIAIYRDGCKIGQPLKKGLMKDPIMPKCVVCGAPTEMAGGCFRCVNCGTVLGCA